MPPKNVISELSELSPGRLLLVVSKEYPEEAFLGAIKFLADSDKQSIIILSMKREWPELERALSENNVPIEKVAIIDATGKTKTPSDRRNISSIKGPEKLATIALSLTGAVRASFGKEIIVVIDSATEIFLHSDPDIFNEFSKHFSFLIKSSGGKGLVFSGEPHKEFLEISERTVYI